LKKAFQKDEAFLEDVRRALDSGSLKIWWLGQSGFLVTQAGRALVLDPYLSDSLTTKYAQTDKPHVRLTERVIDPAALGALGVLDVITSSHNHTDHLDAATLNPLFQSNPQASFVMPAANRSFALERLGSSAPRQIITVDEGQRVTLGPIEITGIASAHPAVERDAEGRCLFLGYVVTWGGITLYHSGDTLWHPGLVTALKPFSIDLALLPINGDLPSRRVAGNLDGPQAAQLAHQIGAKLVIPCHFDLFEFNTADPGPFAAECRRLGQPYHILRNGEGLELSAGLRMPHPHKNPIANEH
jgi:L-ascorbate metabolism protein UlaG (beta-lactamase superfamily)